MRKNSKLLKGFLFFSFFTAIIFYASLGIAGDSSSLAPPSHQPMHIAVVPQYASPSGSTPPPDCATSLTTQCIDLNGNGLNNCVPVCLSNMILNTPTTSPGGHVYYQNVIKPQCPTGYTVMQNYNPGYDYEYAATAVNQYDFSSLQEYKNYSSILQYDCGDSSESDSWRSWSSPFGDEMNPGTLFLTGTSTAGSYNVWNVTSQPCVDSTFYTGRRNSDCQNHIAGSVWETHATKQYCHREIGWYVKIDPASSTALQIPHTLICSRTHTFWSPHH